MRALIDHQSVIKASSQFWEQMLAMTLDPIPHSAGFFAPAGHVRGSVALSGVWNGGIEVRIARGLAYLATAAMMMQPVESVTQADALDATGEIANILAGSIKSSLPRPCAMTVPESALQTDEFRSLPPADDALVVVFRHPAGDLMVRVWEHDCPQ
jgi:CheY-specific phosphatase CheX